VKVGTGNLLIPFNVAFEKAWFSRKGGKSGPNRGKGDMDFRKE